MFLADEVDLRLCGYQEFSPEKGFDLIYLINVFEHLHNWQDFLVFVRQNLNKGGVCVVLAPNYGFPYESHFRLPIIINKRLTYKIFKDYIDRFEKENDFTGLWDSLNFVKWSKVKKTCDELNLSAKFEKEILEKIILRLETDKQFQKRQRFVGMIAKCLYKFRLLKLLQLPFFHAISPYMKFEISHL
jgi:cyclopropane fatty-acyl-phospholipid synthase-like methyltransferase